MIDNSGAIWFLSTSGGSFERIASSESELFQLLDNEDEFNYYFMPQVIALLVDSGLSLKQGECFGFITPNIFAECKYEVSNFKVTSVESYLIGLGDMLNKLQNTADGEKVCFYVTS